LREPPYNNNQVVMFGIIDRIEAEEILESFKQPGMEWIEKVNDRSSTYSDIVKTGNRKEISRIVNTLMRRKYEVEQMEKKLGEPDKRLLSRIQNILFKELAISLDTTYDDIFEEVTGYLKMGTM